MLIAHGHKSALYPVWRYAAAKHDLHTGVVAALAIHSEASVLYAEGNEYWLAPVVNFVVIVKADLVARYRNRRDVAAPIAGISRRGGQRYLGLPVSRLGK